MEILKWEDLDLIEKSWREDLHPRDKNGRFSKTHSWKGIRSGSEVVAKNGTTGKVKEVHDNHYTIEKKDGSTSKIMKKNVIHKDDHAKLTKKKSPAKKTTTKKKTTATKKQANGGKATKVQDPTTKKTTKKAPAKKTSEPKKTTKKAPAKKTSEPKKKATKTPAKKTKKDIRSDVQKNRELAYDAGEKVGGARKDTWEASFKEKPSVASLKGLEKENSAVAQKLVTKQNLLPKFDFEQEHKNGVELPTAIMKKLLQDRIAPKPTEDSPQAREAYMKSIDKFNRHFAGIKTWDNMRNAIREFSDIAYAGKRGAEAENALERYNQNKSRYSYFNEELYQKDAEKGKKAKAQMDFTSLGDKFEGFFTSYKSRESTLKTVQKNTQEGWDKYLNPETKAKNGGKPKTGNKKWERKAEAEHLRKGGKAVKVSKPEDLMKQYGVRGVEFGHWVNDASGKYHLKRSAEAFSDMADVLGIDPKDVSLNGRLAIAFGARGKGGALAHYEPDRKVINMTKHGGAGSLAHEWGHAMDNIMYQYSNGGKESMSLASEHPMGDKDPKLKALYDNLMDAIRKPAPNDKGGFKKVSLDSSIKPPSKYYPEMRNDVQNGMKPEDVYSKWAEKLAGKYDRYIANTKANLSGLRSPQDIEKTVKKYQGQKKRELNALTHYLAQELRYKQNGGKYGGDHYKGEIHVPTGQSEYYTRMQEVDGSGKSYFAQGAEMFARVFESYVQDKLDNSGRYNNYLVHSTREKDVEKFEAPFPKGKERKHMFKAMDNLLKHITKGKALKKALFIEALQKSFNENQHPRDNKGKFSKKASGSSIIAKLAKESMDGMDMYSSAMEDPEHMKALKEAIKNTEGSSISDKLDKIHKQYEGGTNVSEYLPANSIDPHNFELGEDQYPHDVIDIDVMSGSGMEADNGGGRAIGRKILLSSNVLNLDDNQTKDFVFHHEYAHTLTNRFNGLSRHIINNPSGILGKVNQVKSEFEPTLDSSLRLGSAGFRATPEEVWADSYGAYHASPNELKEKNPEIYDFVDKVVSQIPNHAEDLKEAVTKFRNMSVNKSFNENQHPRDSKGKFSKVYHTTKDENFRYDKDYNNSQQEYGRGLYTAKAEDVPYWHRALADTATGERHPYVVPMDVSEANIVHHSEIPAPHTGQLENHLMSHYGSPDKALQAIEDEEKNHVTGETFGTKPFEVAMQRLYAKTKGYDGIYASDGKAENQVVLFDDSKVKYEPAMKIDDFLKKQRWGEL